MTEHAEKVLELINSSNGTIFSCEFIKKDSSLRHMVTRTGVRKGVKGVGMAYDPIRRGLKPTYDLVKARQGLPPEDCWRMINLETTFAIRVRGKTHILI